MADDTTYDLIVIGGGPAGYAGAIRAGQLGRKVACIELERAGGTCLNWGCIPSKALLKSAELYRTLAKAGDFGLEVKGVSYDFAKVMERSRGVADQMAKGVEFLFKKNKVEYVLGRGRIASPGMVEIIEGKEKGRFFKTRNILLATGCKAKQLPGLEVDGKTVLTYREALGLKTQPRSIIILGAGAIGVEFAYFYNAFGTKVTMVEMMPVVVPAEDEEVSQQLARSFSKQGITIHAGARAENIAVKGGKVKLDLAKDGRKESVEAEAILQAVGVAANLEGALAPAVRLELDRGFIKVGDDYGTSLTGIYAAGDIIGPPWLAHVATFEAVQAVNGMFDHGKPRRVTNFPACTYCQPQIASTGLTEQALKKEGVQYNVGKFPFLASGKAVAAGEPEGFVKVLSDVSTGEILGVHIIGAEATELIAEYGLAMQMEGTVEDVHATIHPHPTLSEAGGEAAAAALGEAIHI